MNRLAGQSIIFGMERAVGLLHCSYQKIGNSYAFIQVFAFFCFLIKVDKAIEAHCIVKRAYICRTKLFLFKIKTAPIATDLIMCRAALQPVCCQYSPFNKFWIMEHFVQKNKCGYAISCYLRIGK